MVAKLTFSSILMVLAVDQSGDAILKDTAQPTNEAPSADQQKPDTKPEKRVEVHHAPRGYELVFQDEFSKGAMLDDSKWDYATERNKEGWYNNEKQYYSRARSKNARIEDGSLIIEAHAEQLNKEEYPDWSGQKYTSARILTRGKAAWKYGFFEIKAKLPCGRGTWPAIWTLPEDPDVIWPNGGEIDIMEHVGFDPGVIHQTIHTKAYNHNINTEKTNKFDVPDACDTMHRYQMLWTPDFILFGMNDAPKYLYKNETKGKTNNKAKARWPFDNEHHLLLNIAVGGTWGGQKGISGDAFPARMEIDYVRVYQLKSQPRKAIVTAVK